MRGRPGDQPSGPDPLDMTGTPFALPARPGVANVAGLVTHVSLGQVFYRLYTKVWSPMQSAVFPNVEPSSVAPQGLAPRFGIAINTYSPIAHRNGLDTFVPPPIGDSRGIARLTQRPRGYAPGYVTRWPQQAPRWPTFAESPNARQGGQ